MVVPVFEPLSLHGTDGDEAISDTGEALQACVMSRPKALTGARLRRCSSSPSAART